MKKLFLIVIIFISANIIFAQDITNEDCMKLVQQKWQCELNSIDSYIVTNYMDCNIYGRCSMSMPKRYNERCEKQYKPKIQECFKLVEKK